MPSRGANAMKSTRLVAVAAGICVLLLAGACSSGSSNVARGQATPKRFVPSRTTTPAEAARRSEWRYQSKTRYHNVY